MKNIIAIAAILAFAGCSKGESDTTYINFVHTISVPVDIPPSRDTINTIDISRQVFIVSTDSFLSQFANGGTVNYSIIKSAKINSAYLLLDNGGAGNANLSVVEHCNLMMNTAQNQTVLAGGDVNFSDTVLTLKPMSVNDDVDYISYFPLKQKSVSMNVFYGLSGKLRHIVTDTIHAHLNIEFKIRQSIIGASAAGIDAALHN